MRLVSILAPILLVVIAVPTLVHMLYTSIVTSVEQLSSSTVVTYIVDGASKLNLRIFVGEDLAAFTVLAIGVAPEAPMVIGRLSGYGMASLDLQGYVEHLYTVLRQQGLPLDSRVAILLFYVAALERDDMVELYSGVVPVPLRVDKLLEGTSIYVTIGVNNNEPLMYERSAKLVAKPWPTCVSLNESIYCLRWTYEWGLVTSKEPIPVIDSYIRREIGSLIDKFVHDIYLATDGLRLGTTIVKVRDGYTEVSFLQEGYEMKYPWVRIFLDLHCVFYKATTGKDSYCKYGGGEFTVTSIGEEFFVLTGFTGRIWVAGLALEKTIYEDAVFSGTELLSRVYIVQALPYMDSLMRLEPVVQVDNTVDGRGLAELVWVNTSIGLNKTYYSERGTSVRVTLADCAKRVRFEPNGLLLPVGSILVKYAGAKELSLVPLVLFMAKEDLYGLAYIDINLGTNVAVFNNKCFYMAIPMKDKVVAYLSMLYTPN